MIIIKIENRTRETCISPINFVNFVYNIYLYLIMATIITGLFKSQDQSAKISEDLEKAGFEDSNFIMYLHDKPVSKEIKTSIWQSFFNDNIQLEDDSLVVSVKIKDLQEKSNAEKVFNQNEAVHQNVIENVKFRDAQSLNYLKKIVALRAKSAIYSSPEIRHRGASKGISSEVSF